MYRKVYGQLLKLELVIMVKVTSQIAAKLRDGVSYSIIDTCIVLVPFWSQWQVHH